MRIPRWRPNPNSWPFWAQLGTAVAISGVMVATIGFWAGIGPHMAWKR